jgi:UDP-glucose 4-epimerase
LRAFVTGGAGFIGSAVSKALVREGWDVTIFDNMSSETKDDLSPPLLPNNDSLRIIIGDCTQPDKVKEAILDCDVVFHFAANPEVRMELNSPVDCFKQNVYATHNVLEAFRNSKAKTFVFASTSTVYGDAKTLPTPEDYAPLEPISIYGASKLAGEAMVSSYCHTFDRHGIILRLANVVGPRSKHGVVSEFVAMLTKHPEELQILGDGTQTKSYIHIDDCVDAIMTTIERGEDPVEVFNIGSEDRVMVKDLGNAVARAMGLSNVRFKVNGGFGDGRGWVGDVKTMHLDVTRLKSIGWAPKLNSRGAIELTVKQIMHERDMR